MAKYKKHKSHKHKKDKITGQLFGGGFSKMNEASFKHGENVLKHTHFK